jgi:hypothetical protein
MHRMSGFPQMPVDKTTFSCAPSARQGRLVDMRLPDVILGGILALVIAVSGAGPGLAEPTAPPDSAGLVSASSAAVAGPAPPSAALPAWVAAGRVASASSGLVTASSSGAQTAAQSASPPGWSVSLTHVILPPGSRPQGWRDAAVVVRLEPPVADAPPVAVPSPAAPVAAVAPAPVQVSLRPAPRPAGLLPEPLLLRTAAPLRPRLRDPALAAPLPAMRWDHRPDAELWTRTTLAAVRASGLTDIVPDDIATWCPAYPHAGAGDRAAFWAGVLSALARHESTHNPRAVGGGGLYHGLLQILPSTARQYGCEARTGEELRNGPANLACAVRIAARNIIRDDAVARAGGRNAGIARDWGPMTVASRREEMATWTRAQPYCSAPVTVLAAPRPPVRPWTLLATATPPAPATVSLAMLSHDIRDLRAIPPPRS